MKNSQETVRAIQDKGYWLVSIRPRDFIKQRLGIKQCEEIVINSIVSLRPSLYPYYYIENPFTKIRYRSGYIEGISDIRPSLNVRSFPMSIWRMYESAQFVHLFSCMEDYWETSAGKNVLSFNLTLYILTDIYTFASRLARSNAFDSGLSLGIELSNMKNRYLAEIYPGAIIADRFPILNYKCNISKIQLRRDLSLPEIFGNPIELARADTLQILNKFGLSSRLIEEKLIDEQGKLFRRMYVPISIDDPVRDKQIFRDRLMEELCRKYNNLSRNTLTKDFIFNIEDIRKEAMEGFLRPYWDQMLPELQNEEGLIQILPGGKFAH